MQQRDAPPVEPVLPPTLPARRPIRWIGVGLAAGCGALAVYVRVNGHAAQSIPPPPVMSTIESPVFEASLAPLEADQRDDDAVLVAGLIHDTWIHPLAGPVRRMPATHTGAFGAERPGERPPECVSGHCGVDLGSTWGEPVLAVHEGVIDFVQRANNEDRGGVFVRIGHRAGTLFSWYFHLAAVPRWIQPGTVVRAGQVIGLLGDTGVKRSAPHLHFALSVKPTKRAVERYLDPEPLITIWPLWIPGAQGGRLSPLSEPGVPVRGAKRRRARPAKAAADTDADTDLDTDAAADVRVGGPTPEPASTEPSSSGS